MNWPAILGFISDFTFVYPVLMAYIWISGAFIFVFSHEIFQAGPADTVDLEDAPAAAILIACFNEQENIEETVRNVVQQDYPDFEVIAIDDGSSDDTARILRDLAKELETSRFVQLESNQGKAMALRVGAAACEADYLLVIDADVLLDTQALRRLIPHFLANPKVGAVTGNPRIRNQNTLLTRIQSGEFSSIIGMIKRSESAYGRIFSVSGCIAAFRRCALHQVGYWQVDMITEDVDISWRMQVNGWLVEFEPSALCWVLMPETLKGLWSQRLRWATGGAETLMRYFPKLFTRSAAWMWPIFIEYVISTLWAFSLFGVLAIFLIHQVYPVPALVGVETLLNPVTGMILISTFLLQSTFALFADSRYTSNLKQKLFWMIWYPIGFWVITASSSPIGFFRAFGRSKRHRATWVSPDRGKK